MEAQLASAINGKGAQGVLATKQTIAADAVDESTLRDPLERPTFIASVALNFLLMALALALVFYDPGWLKSHVFLSKQITFLRILAITALVGIPLLVLNRNRREAAIRGNSVRLSDRQFPEIYAILKDHCRRLGMSELPELFVTGSKIQPFSHTFSSYREELHRPPSGHL